MGSAKWKRRPPGKEKISSTRPDGRHGACTETAPSDGSTWTLNGSPSVTLQLAGSVSETSISFQGSQTGTIPWSSGGQSGSCSTNVQYSMSSSPAGAVTVSISGTSCGHDVSGNFTVSN